ncbi:uncharacterized protein N7482_000390 [Penicillium canariense]|uniref:G domain-containing protein n=1 Tax=Penicillium canariense TaxID=189055 RepID=A0A9W9LRZ4_9EURO|nr:uncharacterized protein N7482_000390 [Penicillium canariense]KAJ5174513.1 hypothetical protein N7482_000390 [Penicillium canariense]
MEISPRPSQYHLSKERIIGGVQSRHEPRDSDVYIAVMGVTGAGKSTFISHLAESKVEVGDGTQRVEMYRCKFSGPVNIWLVDTPGFDDTHRSDTDVLREIARWLTESLSANNVILNGMIYLHRITEARMRGSAMNNLFMFKKLCGPNAFKNVILATTVWEQVSPEDGKRREEQLIQTSNFWGEMILGGAQVKRHYNNADSAWRLVDVFASKGSTKQKSVLTIQHEMVNEHKPLDETDAGREIESSLIREREKWSRELKETKDMMHEALKAKDKESLEQLRIAEDKMNKKIEAIELEREELKAGMKRMYEKEVSKLRRELAQQSLNSAGALEKVAQMERNFELMKLQAEQREEDQAGQEEEDSSDEDIDLQLTMTTGDRHSETSSMPGSPIKGNVNISLSGGSAFFSGPKYSCWLVP